MTIYTLVIYGHSSCQLGCSFKGTPETGVGSSGVSGVLVPPLVVGAATLG